MCRELLIKLPSRERPNSLLTAARLYAENAADKKHTRLLISVDDDDHTFTPHLHHQLLTLPIVATVIKGKRSTKIGAVNRDINCIPNWDILLVASDDQWPVVNGYDDVIRRDMAASFPAGDGCLWYRDGHQDRICTQSIMGRMYYDRFGFVYVPWLYKSYYADDHFTETADGLGKLKKLPICLIRHEHPHWRGAVADDALYEYNRWYKQQDKMSYEAWVNAGRPLYAVS